jgi:preprotein translocase subunit YajC
MEQIQQLMSGQLPLFLLMFVVIYFFMIRPQQKKAKSEKEFESSLKVGDKIITKSGLHGKISELADTTVIVETMSGKLKMERSAISMEMSAAMNTPAIKK